MIENPDIGYKDELEHFLDNIISSAEPSDSWDDIILEEVEWDPEGDWAMTWEDTSYSMIFDIMTVNLATKVYNYK